MVGTSEDLSESLNSRNPRSSIKATLPSALSTSASAQGPPYRSSRAFSTDPELTPMRRDAPQSLAAATISRIFSLPRFPGLTRIASAPLFREAMASAALKWMSAMSGIPIALRMRRMARAASSSRTATRMISQPAFSRRSICLTVATTSRVSVEVIDCTATGAPSPTGTGPTRIRLVFLLSMAAGSLMNSPG